jgi:Acyl-protein synthetase, LuxE
MNADVRTRIAAFIERVADGRRADAERDTLLDELSRHQAETVESYRRFVAQESRRPQGRLPALPTDVFRYTRVAAHAAEHDVRVFRTSGTTQAERGTHAFANLHLYDLAARHAAQYALFPDVERMPLVVLAPTEHEARESSLSYMLARFAEWFGAGDTRFVVGNGALRVDELRACLQTAQRTRQPIALLGTSFAFVHAEDALGDERFVLPAGSRIMQTGGFKGRSRSVEPAEMLGLLSARYGLAPEWIVQEYGMTELSSQLYESTLRQVACGERTRERHLWVPSWMRAAPVDANTLLPVAPGEVGVLRIDDLANVDSVCAIQTSDLARSVGDGVVVLGRAPGAVARGCSLTLDQWLAGARDAGMEHA